ncbi:MAG: S24 family peptidase [Trueperaceae bacterium]
MTLNRLCAALNWTVQDVNRATGLDIPIPPSDKDEVALVNPDLSGGTRRIPVYDLLSAGPGGDGGTVIAEVDIPEAWKGDHAAYEVTGDSMAPRIPDGATVIVRCQDYATPGNIIAAYAPENGMLVKLFERATDDGRCVLTSFNPAYASIWADTDELRVYGIVREVRTRIDLTNGNDNGNGEGEHRPN